MFGAIIGAIAGGVASGVTSFLSSQSKVKAYEDAAKSVKNAAKNYSGDIANAAMTQEGYDTARNMSKHNLGNAARINQDASNLKFGNFQNSSNNIQATDMTQGHDLGRSSKATELNAKYNASTEDARRLMKQADINYNAANQAVSGGLSSLGSIINAAKNTSDENSKEGINNASGLPESDIEDSLRQLETVSYKYKDPSIPGCDDEVHDSGFVAQSLEKTPLNDKLDIVQEGKDGVKRVDSWKLQEALMAGIAQMQREIDELKKGEE